MGSDFSANEKFHLYKINPLSPNPTKWSNTLTQFVRES